MCACVHVLGIIGYLCGVIPVGQPQVFFTRPQRDDAKPVITSRGTADAAVCCAAPSPSLPTPSCSISWGGPRTPPANVSACAQRVFPLLSLQADERVPTARRSALLSEDEDTALTAKCGDVRSASEHGIGRNESLQRYSQSRRLCRAGVGVSWRTVPPRAGLRGSCCYCRRVRSLAVVVIAD